MTIAEVLFWSLVVWRITSLFVRDTITAPLRDRIGVYYDEYSECKGKNFVASALCCHRCTSVWVALAVAVVLIHPSIIDLIVDTLALSAGSIIINRITDGE